MCLYWEYGTLDAALDTPHAASQLPGRWLDVEPSISLSRVASTTASAGPASAKYPDIQHPIIPRIKTKINTRRDSIINIQSQLSQPPAYVEDPPDELIVTGPSDCAGLAVANHQRLSEASTAPISAAIITIQ
ncbi:hypothetical protein TEQG_05809 [Trichophyton equinum CBS 127.97]|uniref:Uncharacterized protein n=1 Tax=Trichophyton equinum (strain ATCC MYA-4606 / CBS 127.97) TaxID=559882 RepID=F2PYN1_TRIEC|nr:hypothetical protein TEQG_05809 [Trichophyton equinum CBS 127.97]